MYSFINYRCASIIILLLNFYAINAKAELTIEITQGVDNPTPIAVVPFAWSGSELLPEDISLVVSEDLARSGQFSTLKQQNMLSFPSSAQEIFYRDWRILNVQYLVVGRVSRQAERYTIGYELYDVYKEELVKTQELSGSANELRDLAHFISNQVYELLTGIPGIFTSKLLYVTVTNEGRDNAQYLLQIADADGRRPRTLLQSQSPIVSPSWSPDGKKIAYVSFENTRPAIYIQEVASGNREQLTAFKGLNSSPTWSPDGRYMAMVLSRTGNAEIYLMDLQTRRLRQITRHYGIDTEPSFTPDGSALIFTSNRGGQPQIYQVTLATGWVERLTFEGDYNAKASVLPQGDNMVMVHRKDGVFNIALQDLTRGQIRILSKTSLDESPSIAPNGRMLIYATKSQGRGILAAVSVDGKIQFRLPSTQGDVREPVWSPF